MHQVTVARIYGDPTPGDFRVLVDRVWPRGVTKQDAHLDLWLKNVAPTTELRRWYGHDPAKFTEFRRRYEAELAEAPAAEALRQLRELAADRSITLLTATKDVAHSQAAVLADLLT
jgi:uncharacterized protein YeaO (DUF488 family)